MSLCFNKEHFQYFPKNCDGCHEMVRKALKQNRITDNDYQVYLKNGGFPQ